MQALVLNKLIRFDLPEIAGVVRFSLITLGLVDHHLLLGLTPRRLLQLGRVLFLRGFRQLLLDHATNDLAHAWTRHSEPDLRLTVDKLQLERIVQWQEAIVLATHKQLFEYQLELRELSSRHVQLQFFTLIQLINMNLLHGHVQ